MYFGIDLGTTNSAISMAKVKSDGRVVANTLNTERYVAAGLDLSERPKYTRARKSTLPSCVYYTGRDCEVIVGDYARDQFKKYPENVIRSVKSQMGSPFLQERSDDIADETPEQVSARILAHLKRQAERQNRILIDDVIITVPANFDAAQREATMKAAELAGFNVNNPDGTRKQILISEPNAVLYDISQKIMNGEISDTVLDLSQKRTVLVFDIGGGTLDVTIHELEKEDDDTEKLNIAEIASSRYTKLAGDDFDYAIAASLYERCIKQIKKNNPGALKRVERAKSLVFKLLTVAAEQLKIDMSENAEKGSGGEDDWFGSYSDDDGDEYIAEVSQQIIDNLIYNDSITKDEFEAMVSRFLGYDYQYSDYKGYSSNPAISRDNIIAPILDVLEKADRYYKKQGRDDFHIDAVILNGGMSKLYLIKDRLSLFFNMEPITTADPDLSVANGAAIYACIYAKMHNLETADPTDNRRKNLIEIVRHIQNDDLYIGLAGGASEILISEGAELPYSTEITGFRITPGCDTIEIPIKRGVATGEMPVIARGKITFGCKIKTDMPLKIEASFDTTGLISIKAHLISEVGVLQGTGTVELALGETGEQKITGAAAKIRPRDGAVLNAQNEIHTLDTLYSASGGRKKPKNQQKLKTDRINATVHTIENCGNPEDFEDVILKELNSTKSDAYKATLAQIATEIGNAWSVHGIKELRKFAELCISNYDFSQNAAKKWLYQCAIDILTNVMIPA